MINAMVHAFKAIHLRSFILYSVRVHPAFKNLGRDGKQCNDETDGTYSDGDRRGMFYQRDTSGIN